MTGIGSLVGRPETRLSRIFPSQGRGARQVETLFSFSPTVHFHFECSVSRFRATYVPSHLFPLTSSSARSSPDNFTRPPLLPALFRADLILVRVLSCKTALQKGSMESL